MPASTPETIRHRYEECGKVSHIWEWVTELISILDPMCIPDDTHEILFLNFHRSARESAILWLLGAYVEVIDREIVSREQVLSIRQVRGIFKQRKLMTRYQAMPDLGIIPELDFDQQGVG